MARHACKRFRINHGHSWPIAGNAVNLNYTLAPYLQSLDENTPLMSRPAKRYFGHATLAVCVS